MKQRYNFSWYSPKTDVPGVIEYAKVTDGNPETAKTVTATSSRQHLQDTKQMKQPLQILKVLQNISIV